MEYLELGLKFVGVIVLPLVLFFANQVRNSKKAQAAENESLKDKNRDLRDRVTKLEARVENTPSINAVHELTLKMAEMAGALNTLAAKLSGTVEDNKRTQNVLNRVESYLLENAK